MTPSTWANLEKGPENFFCVRNVSLRGPYGPPSRSNWTPRGSNCFLSGVRTSISKKTYSNMIFQMGSRNHIAICFLRPMIQGWLSAALDLCQVWLKHLKKDGAHSYQLSMQQFSSNDTDIISLSICPVGSGSLFNKDWLHWENAWADLSWNKDWSHWANAQADLSHHWAKSQNVGFVMHKLFSVSYESLLWKWIIWIVKYCFAVAVLLYLLTFAEKCLLECYFSLFLPCPRHVTHNTSFLLHQLIILT